MCGQNYSWSILFGGDITLKGDDSLLVLIVRLEEDNTRTQYTCTEQGRCYAKVWLLPRIGHLPGENESGTYRVYAEFCLPRMGKTL